MGRARRVQALLAGIRTSCGGDGRNTVSEIRNRHRVECGWLLLVGVVLAANVAGGLAAYDCVDSNFRGAPRPAALS